MYLEWLRFGVDNVNTPEFHPRLITMSIIRKQYIKVSVALAVYIQEFAMWTVNIFRSADVRCTIHFAAPGLDAEPVQELYSVM